MAPQREISDMPLIPLQWCQAIVLWLRLNPVVASIQGWWVGVSLVQWLNVYCLIATWKKHCWRIVNYKYRLAPNLACQYILYYVGAKWTITANVTKRMSQWTAFRFPRRTSEPVIDGIGGRVVKKKQVQSPPVVRRTKVRSVDCMQQTMAIGYPLSWSLCAESSYIVFLYSKWHVVSDDSRSLDRPSG